MCNDRVVYDLLKELEIDFDEVRICHSSDFVSDGLLDSLGAFILLSALQDKYSAEYPVSSETGEYVFSLKNILQFIESSVGCNDEK